MFRENIQTNNAVKRDWFAHICKYVCYVTLCYSETQVPELERTAKVIKDVAEKAEIAWMYH